MDRNSKDKRLKCMICSLCVILIIFSCAEKKNRYGINFNNQRSIIKLPLLDSSWKYSPSYTSEGGTWVNPQKEDGVPCYFQKRNLIKNNRDSRYLVGIGIYFGKSKKKETFIYNSS